MLLAMARSIRLSPGSAVTISLPNGTGKTVRDGVFARGAKADEALAAGADGVAVISALSLSPDPALAARSLRNIVDVALEQRKRSA